MLYKLRTTAPTMNLLKEIFPNELLSIELSRLFSCFHYSIASSFFWCVNMMYHANKCYHLYVDALTRIFGVEQIVQSVSWFRLHWTVANVKHVIVQVLTHFVIGREFWRELCTKIIGFQWIESGENEKRRSFRSNGHNSFRSTHILFISRNSVCECTCWTITIPSKIVNIVFGFLIKLKNSIATLSQHCQWIICNEKRNYIYGDKRAFVNCYA